MPGLAVGRTDDRPPVRPVAPGPGGAWGTVLALVGGHLAGEIDLCTRERFKTVAPFSGSPFAMVGEPDEELAELADGAGLIGRARSELRKDLASQLRGAHAHALVVDHTTALRRLRTIGGLPYSIAGRDEADPVHAVDLRAHAEDATWWHPSRQGLTDELAALHDAFTAACLEVFAPERIILVRSHLPRFWADEDGRLAPTNVHDGASRFLFSLDDRFVRATRCLVSDVALFHVPTSAQWAAAEPRLRVAVEDDVVRLLTAPTEADRRRTLGRRPDPGAARHVVRKLAAKRAIDHERLHRYFAAGGATQDDLLALAYLRQQRPKRTDALVRDGIRAAVADEGSAPRRRTRRAFERSVAALREAASCQVRLPREVEWEPQITLDLGAVRLRLRADGSLGRRRLPALDEATALALAAEEREIAPADVPALLASWPYHLERGRRGATAAPVVMVDDNAALLDTCSWLDWSDALGHETLTVRARERRSRRRPRPGRGTPRATTDLSFLFDPRTRVCTVTAGMMDQVTYLGLFHRICAPHGLEVYVDDLRYTYRRLHNGFEASRFAPAIEARRLSRLLSVPLLETYRRQVATTDLPWVYGQTQALRDLGLRDAHVITRDEFPPGRLAEAAEHVPLHVYTDETQVESLVVDSPGPVTFLTSLQRIRIGADSAAVLGEVFDFRVLDEEWKDPATTEILDLLRSRPHVALHVRRGDYLRRAVEGTEWFGEQEHYRRALQYVVEVELGTTDLDVAVFSDDLAFVEANAAAYGLDLVTGTVRFVHGHHHFESIFDAYAISLCPVVVGSVGYFAATSSLLAEPPSTYVRALPSGPVVRWRRA